MDQKRESREFRCAAATTRAAAALWAAAARMRFAADCLAHPQRLTSFRQTCRLPARATYSLLVDVLKPLFKEHPPNLGWRV